MRTLIIFTDQGKLWIRDDPYPGWKAWSAGSTASWPPGGFQALQGWDVLYQFLVFIWLTTPVHRELGHVHSEEIRECFHVLREAASCGEVTRRRSRLFLWMLRNFHRWICRERVSDVENGKTIVFQSSEISPTTIRTFLFLQSLGKLVQENCLSQTKCFQSKEVLV